MRPTDRGMCCTFNAAQLEETLRDGNFTGIVKNLQFQVCNLIIMLQPLILVQRLSIRDADAVNLKWQKERDKTRGN